MLTKLTILAILTLSVMCNHSESNSNGGTTPNFQGKNTENANEFENDIIAFGTFIFMVLAFLVIAGLNFYLCVKCMNKRAVNKKIKEQMMFKRMEFATNNGLSIQQLNDPRFSQTLHIWSDRKQEQ